MCGFSGCPIHRIVLFIMDELFVSSVFNQNDSPVRQELQLGNSSSTPSILQNPE